MSLWIFNKHCLLSCRSFWKQCRFVRFAVFLRTCDTLEQSSTAVELLTLSVMSEENGCCVNILKFHKITFIFIVK